MSSWKKAADENFENLRKQYASGVQRIRDESDESIDIRTFLRFARIKNIQSRCELKRIFCRQTEEHIRRSVATCEEGVAGKQSQVKKNWRCSNSSQFLFEIVFSWRWSWSPPPWQLASQTASWWPWQGDQRLWFRRKQPEFGLKSCFFRESENSEDVSLKKQVVAGIILLMNSFLVWSFLSDSEIFYLRCIV